MASDNRIDPNLQIAMQLTPEELIINTEAATGFDPVTNTWRLIIKYGGDIYAASSKYHAVAEVLSDTYAIITISEDYITSFAREPEVEYIEKPKGLQFEQDTAMWDACIPPVNNFQPYMLRGNGVLVGVIDSGIDYSHPDFRNEDGSTRIIRIWDQSLDGNPPEGFAHGTEYTEEEINAILDDPAYRNRPLPSADISGHGTMVAGIAAGNGRASGGHYRGVAPDAAIAVVKLGAVDYEGYPIKNIDVMFGVRYLLNIARNLNMPLSINLSYGTSFGSRDGNGLFETYMSDIALNWKSVIVTGTGNDAAKQLHTNGAINNRPEIEFIISGYTDVISLELWKPGADDILIELIHPNGGSTGVIPNLQQVLRYRFGGESVVVLYNRPTPFQTSSSIHIEIMNNNGSLQEGLWLLRLHPRAVIFGIYNIWMHSNNDVCRFINPSLENTLTLPATAQNLISVTAYDNITGKIAGFAGRGSAESSFMKPDIAAPGIGITAPYPRGGYETGSGTSLASPFVAGACALIMEWGIVKNNDPYLYGGRLKTALYSGAIRVSGLTFPNIIWGFGKMCLKNSMDFLSTDSAIRMAQLETPEDPAEIEQTVRSNEFISFLAYNDVNLQHLAFDNPDIILGAQYEPNRVIVYLRRSVAYAILPDIRVILNPSFPLLFGLLDVESLNASNILPVRNNPSLNLTGKQVLIGFVDTGIDYTHPAFIDQYGNTRIRIIWDQTALTGNPPENYLFGTEYTAEQINEALHSDRPFDIVPTQDDNGHGTFLAGVACGNHRDQYSGVAPDAEIIFVKLAPAKQYARENSMLFNENAIAYQETDVLLGIDYLINKAREYNQPLSLLLGIGSNQGSHTGLSYGNLISSYRSLCFTSAGGNEGNTMKHAEATLEGSRDSTDIEFNVAEDEAGLAIYIWGYAPDKFSVGLISPSGEVIERLPVRNSSNIRLDLVFYNTTIWIDYHIGSDVNGDQLAVVRLRNPEPGLWIINLYGDVIINGHFHAWLPMQNWCSPDTYFIESSANYTITELANSEALIAVGSYNPANMHLAIDSSRGPSRYEVIRPDLIAPGVNITGPQPGGGYQTMSGTSVAAANVAGAAALMFEWGIVNKNQIDLNTPFIRSLLIAGARRRSGITYPNNLYGYGEMDVLNTFTELNTNQVSRNYGLFLREQ